MKSIKVPTKIENLFPYGDVIVPDLSKLMVICVKCNQRMNYEQAQAHAMNFHHHDYKQEGTDLSLKIG